MKNGSIGFYVTTAKLPCCGCWQIVSPCESKGWECSACGEKAPQKEAADADRSNKQ